MKKQILLRVLLCLTMAVGLLPTMVFASGVTGSGKEDDPYVYEVSTASELSEAVTAINADTVIPHTIPSAYRKILRAAASVFLKIRQRFSAMAIR